MTHQKKNENHIIAAWWHFLLIRISLSLMKVFFVVSMCFWRRRQRRWWKNARREQMKGILGIFFFYNISKILSFITFASLCFIFILLISAKGSPFLPRSRKWSSLKTVAKGNSDKNQLKSRSEWERRKGKGKKIPERWDEKRLLLCGQNWWN